MTHGEIKREDLVRISSHEEKRSLIQKVVKEAVDESYMEGLQAGIETMSTADIVRELIKRDCVMQELLPQNDKVQMTFTNAFKPCWFNGPVRILVVKE